MFSQRVPRSNLSIHLSIYPTIHPPTHYPLYSLLPLVSSSSFVSSWLCYCRPALSGYFLRILLLLLLLDILLMNC